MEDNIIIHDGHRERLRQRILTADPETLEPHEMLEFLLYFVLPRQDVNELAHALLDYFGSLRNLFRAGEDELMAVQNMGLYTARWLRLVNRCAGLAINSLRTPVQLKNYADVFEQARMLRRKYNPPCCIQLCADREERMIYRRPICHERKWGRGEILQEALADVIACRARRAYLIILTNEYLPIPGRYDREKVRGYSHLLDMAGCMLLDVVLLGKYSPISMRRMGMVPDPRRQKNFRSIREDYMRGMPSAEEMAAQHFSFYRETGGKHEPTEPV